MNEFISTINSKGQAMMPFEVRRGLGLKHGDRVSFFLEDCRAIMKLKASVTEATAGVFRSAVPLLSAEELPEAAEIAIAEDVSERYRSACGHDSDRIPGIIRTEP